LKEEILKTLKGENKILNIEIKGEFKIQKGGFVFPSQLFLPEKPKVGKNEISRNYFIIHNPFSDKKQVGITSEKINNALRRYDIVKDGEEEKIIAIEPSGSDMTTKKSFRGKGKRLNELYLKLVYENYEDLTPNDKIFIIGCLIRGGLFNEASDKTK